MRILHLTTSFPLQSSSVSGIFINRLITGFPSKIKTTVLTPDSVEFVNVAPENFLLITFRYCLKRWQVLAHGAGGLPVSISVSRWRILLLPPFFISMLWSTVIRARQSDVIHAHWTINGVIAGIAGKLTQTPVVTTLRGEDVNRGQSSLVHRCLLQLCLRWSDIIVTVSSRMYEDICKRFPVYASKLSFIPNGVSDEFFSLPLPGMAEKPTILVLGSLISRKGIDLVITALSICCRAKRWHLIIAGTGPEKEKLCKLLNQKGLEENVKFIGQIPPDEVVCLFEKADILVQASYREGRPNVVLEAMAAGVTVIGSNIDGINELIDHKKNGLLFTAGNAEELSINLELLLDSPQLRNTLGKMGRQTMYKHNLSWSRCVVQYVNHYDRLIAEGQS